MARRTDIREPAPTAGPASARLPWASGPGWDAAGPLAVAPAAGLPRGGGSLGPSALTRPTVPSQRLQLARQWRDRTLALLPAAGCLLALHQVLTEGLGVMELTLLASLWLLSQLGLVLGFRRMFAQRAIRAAWPVQALLVVLGSMAGQGSLVHWVSWYRCHGALTQPGAEDRAPVPSGVRARALALWRARVGWMFAQPIPNPAHHAVDLLRQPGLMRIANPYGTWVALGLVLPAVAGGLWTGTLHGALSGALWGGPVRLFLGGHAWWTLHAIGQRFAARPNGADGRTDDGHRRGGDDGSLSSRESSVSDGGVGVDAAAAPIAPPAATVARRMTADIEEGLIGRIAELLAVPRKSVDPAHSLAELGFDSITVVALVADLEEWLGIAIDPALPFHSTSIRELSAQVAGMTG